MKMKLVTLLCLLAYCKAAPHEHHHDDHHEGHDEHHHDDHENEDHDHPHNHRLGDHLGQLLSMDQDHYHPSVGPDGKVVVDTSMVVRSVGPLNKDEKTLTLTLTYRESFIDSRLADDGRSGMATLVGKDCDQLWTPDTFFVNSVEEEVIGGIKPNCYARVNPDGRVQVSRRMRVKTKFSLNDHITKRYGLTIASYGYHKDQIEYTGSPDSVTILPSAKETIENGGLTVEEVVVANKDVTTKTGEYSILDVRFKLGELVDYNYE